MIFPLPFMLFCSIVTRLLFAKIKMLRMDNPITEIAVKRILLLVFMVVYFQKSIDKEHAPGLAIYIRSNSDARF
jgi:hypothetical protein